jgi:hypothetical protein
MCLAGMSYPVVGVLNVGGGSVRLCLDVRCVVYWFRGVALGLWLCEVGFSLDEARSNWCSAVA